VTSSWYWGGVNTAVRGQFITRNSLPLVRDTCSFMESKSHRPTEADVCSASRESAVRRVVHKSSLLNIIVFVTVVLQGPPNVQDSF
jgi:hypothetical protein